MRACCRALRPRMAASACRRASCRACGSSASSACASSSRATTWRPRILPCRCSARGPSRRRIRFRDPAARRIAADAGRQRVPTGAGSRPIQMAQATTTANDAGKAPTISFRTAGAARRGDPAGAGGAGGTRPLTTATDIPAEPSPLQPDRGGRSADVETTATTPVVGHRSPRPDRRSERRAGRGRAAGLQRAGKAAPAGNEPYKAAPSRTRPPSPPSVPVRWRCS